MIPLTTIPETSLAAIPRERATRARAPKMIRASQIHRLRLCPGSLQAEEGLPESGNAYSEAGTRIHKMLETSSFEGASADEIEILTDLIRMKSQVIDDILGACKRPFHVVREKELYVYDDDGNKKIVGHPDEVILAEHPTIGWVALILDAKTGFLEVDSAEENDQLRTYSIGVPEMAGVDVRTVYAKIIQRFFKHLTVEYDEKSLIEARADVLGVVRDAEAPDAKRIPSEPACRYCRALGTPRCSETSKIVELAVAESDASLSITGEQIAARLEVFSIAEKIIDKERAAFKARLEKDPSAIPGWYLKPGNVITSIADSQRAFEILDPVFSDHFGKSCPDVDKVAELSLALFQSCVTVSKGKIETALRTATGLVGKKLEDEIARLLKPVLVSKPNSPSLAKMPKAMLKEKK